MPKLMSGMMNIFTAEYSTTIRWTICFFCLFVLGASGDTLKITLDEYANKPFGNIIFLRHAFAPGIDANGAPAKFKIDDCSTQRNLDSTGRTQATVIGEKFNEYGVKFGFIYSSQWCRCLETAQLLKLGEVFPEVSLNSGFKGLFKQEKTLAKLRKNLESLKNESQLVLMVTHQGIISAITGIHVNSGGAVAYNIKTKSSKVISFE